MLAIISGATKGIGKATVEALSSEGYDIIAISKSEKNLKLLKKNIENEYHNKLHCYPCDLENKLDRQNLMHQLEVIKKDVKILVNNFGKYSSDNILNETSENLINSFDINTLVAFELCQLISPIFKDKKEGHIFNICSIVSKKVRKEAAAYSISKNSLKALNDLIREELRPYQVKVCAIYPASVSTSSWDNVSHIDRQKMIQASDIAKIICTNLHLSQAAFMEEVTVSCLDSNY